MSKRGVAGKGCVGRGGHILANAATVVAALASVVSSGATFWRMRLLKDLRGDEDVDVLFRGAGAFPPKHASEKREFAHDRYVVFPFDGFY